MASRVDHFLVAVVVAVVAREVVSVSVVVAAWFVSIRLSMTISLSLVPMSLLRKGMMPWE